MNKTYENSQLDKKQMKKLKRAIFKLYDNYYFEDILKYFGVISGEFLSQAETQDGREIDVEGIIEYFSDRFKEGYNFRKKSQQNTTLLNY